MTSLVLGIDPGPIESAFAQVQSNYTLAHAGKIGNGGLIDAIRKAPPAAVACESIQSYGMPVGRSTFDTCYAIGRFMQVCIDHAIPFFLYPRPEYARRICGTGKVNDSVIRQALLLRFGDDRKGGPLYCLKGDSDKRSAFSVAVYHLDQMSAAHVR